LPWRHDPRWLSGGSGWLSPLDPQAFQQLKRVTECASLLEQMLQAAFLYTRW
jgi:hypothetical protein